jgi:hypothetical protein
VVGKMTTQHDALGTVAGEFVALVGAAVWTRRMREVRLACAGGQRTGRAMQQRFAVEIAIERMLRHGRNEPPSPREVAVLGLAEEWCDTAGDLTPDGRDRLRTALRSALHDAGTLVPLFHLARTARLHRARGFAIAYAGLDGQASFDLLLSRAGAEAELACDVVSAEDGRDLHRGAWVRLVDRIDPDLQTWLAAHPGRYLLKMTLPQGLQDGPAGQDRLASLHGRIRTMLEGQRRADHDEAAVLRLDPLMLAGAQADELGLLARLRQEFGHEAHLAITAGNGGVFVMAARSGREDAVAVAVRHRMDALAPTRLSGARPGILAILVEDTDRIEWRHLRDRLILEGEARRFLTHKEARGVVAVACSSRLELLGEAGPDGAPDGELRFRNPSHPAAREAALAGAVLSSG